MSSALKETPPLPTPLDCSLSSNSALFFFSLPLPDIINLVHCLLSSLEWEFHEGRAFLGSALYTQGLAQCLTHSRCSINIFNWILCERKTCYNSKENQSYTPFFSQKISEFGSIHCNMWTARWNKWEKLQMCPVSWRGKPLLPLFFTIQNGFTFLSSVPGSFLPLCLIIRAQCSYSSWMNWFVEFRNHLVKK